MCPSRVHVSTGSATKELIVPQREPHMRPRPTNSLGVCVNLHFGASQRVRPGNFEVHTFNSTLPHTKCIRDNGLSGVATSARSCAGNLVAVFFAFGGGLGVCM